MKIMLAPNSIVYVNVPGADPITGRQHRTFRITTREVNHMDRGIAPRAVYDVDFNNLAVWSQDATFNTFEEAMNYVKEWGEK